MPSLFLKLIILILPLIIAQSNLAVLPEAMAITTSNTDSPLKQINQSPLDLIKSANSEGNPDLKMQASIQRLTEAFKSSLAKRPDKLKNPNIDQPSTSSQPICDQTDLASKNPEFEYSAEGLKINLDEQRSIERQLTSGLNRIQEDEALARSLQREEYSTLNSPVKADTPLDCTADGAHKKPVNGFNQDILEEFFSPYASETNPCYCCSASKRIPSGTSMLLDDVFMTNCKKHHVEYQGKQYLQMYHGTTSNQLKSFKEKGIQAIGDGDLGAGFYLTSDFEYAHRRGQNKTYNSKEESNHAIIIGILVPILKLVKNFGQMPPSDQVFIERHIEEGISHKFVFRQAILDQLIANKLYMPGG